MATPGKEKAIAPAPIDMDDLLFKGNALITAMDSLREGADEVSRTAPAFLDALIRYENEKQHLQSHAISEHGNLDEQEDDHGVRKRAKRANSDTSMPKRPVSANFIFRQGSRATVKADLGPKATQKQIDAELSKRWSNATEIEKKIWKDMYQERQEIYSKNNALQRAGKATQHAESSVMEFSPLTELNSLPDSEEHNDWANELGGSKIETAECDVTVVEEEKTESMRPAFPPPHKKPSKMGKKDTTTNGSLGKTHDLLAVTASSPIAIGAKAKAGPIKRKRVTREKAIK